MTIALAVRVHDGMVLATDSASTITGLPVPGGGAQVFNVYNNANKLFNLVKGLPVAGMTWGTGSIGTSSISTHIKDLRRRMTTPDPGHPEWHLDPAAYTVGDVALRVRDFLNEQVVAAPNPHLNGGFLVAGYSVGSLLAETWLINLNNGAVEVPVQQYPNNADAYAVWYGQGEAVSRLLLGLSEGLAAGLVASGVPQPEVPAWLATIQQHTQVGLMHTAMPIQDAIDLAEWLACVASQFSRFAFGPSTVGGPIDVAAITKHEGFKWVKRKYWYDRELNPHG